MTDQAIHTATVGTLRVKIRRVPGLPLVAGRLWWRGGALLEEIPGQALLTGRLLAEGSHRRGWERIALEAEDRGMLLQSFGTLEAIGVAIDGLASDASRILDWLAELALEPSFPEDRLRWLRRQTNAERKALLDQPDYRTGRAFLTQLYGDHPYGRPVQGEAESLRRVSRARCRRFHRQALAWGGCLILTGDLEIDRVMPQIEKLFGDLEVASPATAAALALPTGGPTRAELVAGEADQAHLYLGHLTLTRRDPDLPALELASIILGAGTGMAGRLPNRIRDLEGLAYAADVATASGAGLAPGRLLVYVGTSPKTVDRAETAVREELQRFVSDGITDAEFEDARSYLLGREPFRRETLRQWADLMADAELYDLPTDQPGWLERTLMALTREEVQRVVERWIKPDELSVTVGLPRA